MGSTDRRPPAGRSSSEARPVSARAASLAPSSKRPSTVAPRPWSVRACPRPPAPCRTRRSSKRSASRPARPSPAAWPACSDRPGTRLDGCSPRWMVRRERPAAASYGRPRTDGSRPCRPGTPVRGDPHGLRATRTQRADRPRDRGHPMGGRWDPKPHRVPVAKPPEPAGGTARDAADGHPDPLVPTTRLLGELERQSWVERIELDP